MPKMGLELHSRLCKHWVPAETCGIRPLYILIRGPKCARCAHPRFAASKLSDQRPTPSNEGMRSFLVLTDFAQLEERLRSQNPRTTRRHKRSPRWSGRLVRSRIFAPDAGPDPRVPAGSLPRIHGTKPVPTASTDSIWRSTSATTPLRTQRGAGSGLNGGC